MADAIKSVQATCVAIDGRACLLFGPSGAGKSDLALRCIATPVLIGDRHLRASLVADDGVLLERMGERLIARPPAAIAGKLEVRGLGIVDIPHVTEADVVLVVKLVRTGEVQRFPDPQARDHILGVELPVISIAPFEPSASQKVLLALAAAGTSGGP